MSDEKQQKTVAVVFTKDDVEVKFAGQLSLQEMALAIQLLNIAFDKRVAEATESKLVK